MKFVTPRYFWVGLTGYIVGTNKTTGPTTKKRNKGVKEPAYLVGAAVRGHSRVA